MERKEGKKRKSVDSPDRTKSVGECPSCHQIPRANIFQCTNGHSLCHSCSTKVTVCPTCQSPGVTIRNLLAESLLDDQKFKCKWGPQGCGKTMKRHTISEHEDDCAHNPDLIKFCSKFPEAKKCSFKFTSKWLSELENYIEFENHVKTCLNIIYFNKAMYGEEYTVRMRVEDVLLKKFNASRLAHHSYSPLFIILPPSNQKCEVQLLVLFILLKFDTSRNQTLSFAFVQLTPETKPMVVKLTIDGKPSIIAHFGENSVPSLNWTQKPMCFRKFMEMVEKSSDNPEADVPFPYSIPVSLLSNYYSCEEKTGFSVKYTVGYKP